MNVDFFKSFFVGKKEKRSDLNNVFSEALSLLLSLKIPESVRAEIIELNKIESEKIRKNELENYLSKEDVKIVFENDKMKLSDVFGFLYDRRLYSVNDNDLSVIERKANDLIKTDGSLLVEIFEFCVKDWVKLGKDHCLTMKIGKYQKDFDMYCLINGSPSNLSEVTIFIKIASNPCEFISMNELLSIERDKRLTDKFRSVFDERIAKEGKKTVDSLLKLVNAKERDFKEVIHDKDYFSILSVGFGDKIMNSLESIYEMTPECSIDLLKEHLGFFNKKVSLYAHFVYFLLSKSLSNVSLNIDMSALESYSEIKDGFVDYFKSLI